MPNHLQLVPSLALAALCATIGCDKKDDAASSKENTSGAKVAPETAKAEPFTGKLTFEVLKKANRSVPMYGADAQPAAFAPALAAAKTALGEPTHVDGNDYAWGFVEGESCTYYRLSDKDGKADSGGVARVSASAGSMHEDCLKALGKFVEPTPDPNAPKVPTDGKPIAPTVLIAGVAGDEAAWLGQEVSVTGLYFSTSTTTADGEKTIILSIIDSKDNKKDTMSCRLEDGAEAPKIMQYDPITVKGKVRVAFSGGLESCSIVK